MGGKRKQKKGGGKPPMHPTIAAPLRTYTMWVDKDGWLVIDAHWPDGQQVMDSEGAAHWAWPDGEHSQGRAFWNALVDGITNAGQGARFVDKTTGGR